MCWMVGHTSHLNRICGVISPIYLTTRAGGEHQAQSLQTATKYRAIAFVLSLSSLKMLNRCQFHIMFCMCGILKNSEIFM